MDWGGGGSAGMAAVNSVCDTVQICTRELSGDDVSFTYIERNHVHLQDI